MAARKTHTLSQTWKKAIQTTMLIKRLQDHVKGDIELNKSQVSAALGLLKKTAPDLSSVALGQDENLGPVQVTWES
jgi:hypothetical protein